MSPGRQPEPAQSIGLLKKICQPGTDNAVLFCMQNTSKLFACLALASCGLFAPAEASRRPTGAPAAQSSKKQAANASERIWQRESTKQDADTTTTHNFKTPKGASVALSTTKKRFISSDGAVWLVRTETSKAVQQGNKTLTTKISRQVTDPAGDGSYENTRFSRQIAPGVTYSVHVIRKNGQEIRREHTLEDGGSGSITIDQMPDGRVAGIKNYVPSHGPLMQAMPLIKRMMPSAMKKMLHPYAYMLPELAD
ncbi:MAG: hypothetical protein IPL79_19445 [Myxococcales bacterium]|nr:hypothetical protein [Myxococcales bacterium]